MADITYCTFGSCPLRQCERHPSRIPRPNFRVTIADFAPTCRQYIAYLIREIERDYDNE